MMLTPQQAVKLMESKRVVSTMPVPYVTKVVQRGKGCGCGQSGGCQTGGDFLGIGHAFQKVGKAITSNPLRLAAAIGTAGLSETFLTPAQLIGDKVGVKPSKALSAVTPVLGVASTLAGAPEIGKAAGYTATGLKMMGLGKKGRKGKRKRKN